MLPCPMSSSQSIQSPSPPPGFLTPCALNAPAFSTLPPPFNAAPSPINSLSLSPSPAALTGRPEPHEKKTTLSLASATLTSCVSHKSFACRSCKKHPGAGVPGAFHPKLGEESAFFRSPSPPSRQSHPPKGNPSLVPAFFRHQLRITTLPRLQSRAIP